MIKHVLAGSDAVLNQSTALVFFVLFFGVVCIYAWTKKNKQTFDDARFAPLDEEIILEQPGDQYDG